MPTRRNSVVSIAALNKFAESPVAPGHRWFFFLLCCELLVFMFLWHDAVLGTFAMKLAMSDLARATGDEVIAVPSYGTPEAAEVAARLAPGWCSWTSTPILPLRRDSLRCLRRWRL